MRKAKLKFASVQGFFLCFLYCLSFTSYCQILIGPKIGINNSWATVDTRNISNTATEHINGLQLGIVLDYGLGTYISNYGITHFFSIRSELTYNEKGYMTRKYFNNDAFSNKNEQNSSTWKFQTKYLELPVMAKWSREGERLKFYVNGGLYMGYWVSAIGSGSFFVAGLGAQYYERKDVQQDYSFDNTYGSNNRRDNRWDYGLALGSGIAYKVKRGEFFIEGRYSHGLADRFSFQGAVPKSHSPQLNRNWTVSVGFLLTISKKKTKKLLEEEDEEESSE